MAWDESDKAKNQPPEDKDPWSGKRKSDPQTDIDQLLENFKSYLSKFAKGGKGKGDEPNNGETAFNPGRSFGVILIVAALIWFVSGFYLVQPAQQAVVLRFGKYISTQDPGLHWYPRLIDSVTILDTQKIYTYSYEAEMLTNDENIVSVAVTVFYRINNPKEFLFNLVNPLESLRQATASALRQVIGQTQLDAILTTGRDAVRDQTFIQLKNILTPYNSGIEVTQLALQQAKAPEQVKAAFDDAIKAQEDEKRYVNEAQAYAMKVEPIAQGQAQRIIQDARAYQQQVVLQAQADTARFNALYGEYRKAPQIMRERLYIDAIEKMLANSSKILLANGNGNNIVYLPLEQLLKDRRNLSQHVNDAVDQTTSTSTAVLDQALTPTISAAANNAVNRPLRDMRPNSGGS